MDAKSRAAAIEAIDNQVVHLEIERDRKIMRINELERMRRAIVDKSLQRIK